MNNYVTVKREVLDAALDWAKTHCPSYITNDYHMSGYNLYDHSLIDFYFADTKDQVLFMLIWA